MNPPSDNALLIHAMFLIAGAAGTFDEEETAVVVAFANSVPEFENTTEQELHAMIGDAQELARRFGDPQATVAALSQLSTSALKQKAFLLAADIALSSGDVDEAEDAMLESMARALDIDEDTANTIVNVLAIRYAR